jgi:PAS domain S-box-containing protein
MERNVSFAAGDVSDADAIGIFSASRIAMVLTNPRLEDNPIVYVNRAFEKLTGYSKEVVIGRNCRFLQCDDTQKDRVKQLREAIDEGRELSLILLNSRANGERFRNALLISPVTDKESGEIEYFLGLQTELESDHDDEKLQEFETAISEIQHRVKNHLSMILGLIRMQMRQQNDNENYKNLARRVESLQLLYEEMSAAGKERNDGKIQLGAYLGRVANAIAHLDGRPGVRMNVNVEPLVIEAETAVRIGLVVSEVLTNAMQHAFVDQKSGLVEIRVTRTDRDGLRVTVSDDGVGIPEDIDWPGDFGLGGRIVEGLCQGLDATLNVSNGAVGTVVTFDVPHAE